MENNIEFISSYDNNINITKPVFYNFKLIKDDSIFNENYTEKGNETNMNKLDELENNIVNNIINESKEYNKSISFVTNEELDYEEAPYLIGSIDDIISSSDFDIPDPIELTEEELWIIGWNAYVSNLSDKPFNSFDDINFSILDFDYGNQYQLDLNKYITKDIKENFLKEINDYINHNNIA